MRPGLETNSRRQFHQKRVGGHQPAGKNRFSINALDVL